MQSWIWWLIIGCLSMAAGVIALANPFAATLTAELMAGYLFIFIGVLTILTAFQDQGWGGRIWALLLGVALTLLGINLVTHPLEGILTLTFAVAALMLIAGVFRIILALTPLAASFRVPLLLSGVVSIILAVLIFANFPEASAVALGLLLAIELMSNGLGLIVISLSRRKDQPA